MYVRRYYDNLLNIVLNYIWSQLLGTYAVPVFSNQLSLAHKWHICDSNCFMHKVENMLSMLALSNLNIITVLQVVGSLSSH